MTVPNFMLKAGSYQDLGREALYTPPRDIITQKCPRAARVKMMNRLSLLQTCCGLILPSSILNTSSSL